MPNIKAEILELLEEPGGKDNAWNRAYRQASEDYINAKRASRGRGPVAATGGDSEHPVMIRSAPSSGLKQKQNNT